jgi:hypothetical protein
MNFYAWKLGFRVKSVKAKWKYERKWRMTPYQLKRPKAWTLIAYTRFDAKPAVIHVQPKDAISQVEASTMVGFASTQTICNQSSGFETLYKRIEALLNDVSNRADLWHFLSPLNTPTSSKDTLHFGGSTRFGHTALWDRRRERDKDKQWVLVTG